MSDARYSGGKICPALKQQKSYFSTTQYTLFEPPQGISVTSYFPPPVVLDTHQLYKDPEG